LDVVVERSIVLPVVWPYFVRATNIPEPPRRLVGPLLSEFSSKTAMKKLVIIDDRGKVTAH
jgi:hypothetical protein